MSLFAKKCKWRLGFLPHLFMTMLLLLQVGCRGLLKPPTAIKQTSKPAVMPSYMQLAKRYNANLKGLEQIWAKAIVQVQFQDQDGRHRFEQGDESTLMIHLPSCLALEIRKFGVGRIFWVGGNETQYWFFDLLGKNKVYFGTYRQRIIRDKTASPWHVSPLDIPLLMGLLPLAKPASKASQPVVKWDNGFYSVQLVVVSLPQLAALPDNESRGFGEPLPATNSRNHFGKVQGNISKNATTTARLWIDPKTYLPCKIERLNRAGNVVVSSVLGDGRRVKTADKNQDNWPLISTRIDISANRPNDLFIMSLQISRMTTAQGPHEKAKAHAFKRAFDFDYLMNKAFRVTSKNRINLDR